MKHERLYKVCEDFLDMVNIYYPIVFVDIDVEYIAYSGHRTGRSLLMEDGALKWLIVNSKTASESTRRHMELALCHLAQNGMLTLGHLNTGKTLHYDTEHITFEYFSCNCTTPSKGAFSSINKN